MNPLISVLMVAHNAGRYLPPAVASIFAQSHSHLELILVDNGSTDASAEALAKTCQDKRLRLVRLPENRFHNGGLIAGLPHCLGDYVAIMDADDISLPQRLEKQLVALDGESSFAAIGCAALTINPEGAVVGREFTLCALEEISEYTRYDMPFIFPTLMGRRQLFADFPFHPRLAMAHDLDLIGRALQRCKISCLPEVLFHYRRHPQSTTASKLATLFANASVVRIAHARLQAGRADGMDVLLAEKDQLLANNPAPRDVFAHYARQALKESLHHQAIWHARKAAVFGSKFTGLNFLLKALGSAGNLPADERKFLWRFAMLGAVKAYRLHPLAP